MISLSLLLGKLNLTNNLHLLGIDRAIGYTLVSRGWQLLSGVFSVFFVAKYLSPYEQGYFYTFFSVLNIQIMFELGLNYVVLQFVSHEYSKLSWTEHGIVDGNNLAKARLGSLLRIALKWYVIGSGLFLVLILPIGLWFFSNNLNDANTEFWKYPWILLVLFSSFMLAVSPIFSILEGCGLIANVAKFRVFQDIITYPIYWTSLYLGFGLFSNPIMQMLRLIIALFWLTKHYSVFIFDLLCYNFNNIKINWFQEIWPMQWKIAISWFSGFFITQLFNPYIFHNMGPIYAGKMGMSLTIISGLVTLALSWMNTKIPLFGQMIVNKEYYKLDNLFFLTLKKSFYAYLIGSGLILTTVLFLSFLKVDAVNRILDSASFSLLLVPTALTIVTISQAIYLRAHKQEPFIWISVTQAILTCFSVIILGHFWGIIGIIIGNAITLIIVFILGTIVFIRKRKFWH